MTEILDSTYSSSPGSAPRRRLSLLPWHPGGRSATVCHFKCDDACAKPAPNTSDNAYMGDIIQASLSRRSMLVAAGASAFAAGAAMTVLNPTAAAANHRPVRPRPPTPRPGTDVFGFEPIPPTPADVDDVTVPVGYSWSTIIAWGDPVLPGAPEFDYDNQTAAAQAAQFGYNNDYAALMDLGRNSALLINNFEYTNDDLMFPGYTGSAEQSVEQLRIAMMAHGMGVVELERDDETSPWHYLRNSHYNRRITPDTEFEMTGPAAGSRLLCTSADPAGRRVLGTLNNCAGGTTPWGTVLSGEENFNQYFVVPAPPDDPQVAAGYERYGIDSTSGRDWFRADARFDTTVEPNEPHRFGWIVEMDPHDPGSTPSKHTAMGRVKHEGATIALSRDRRAVAYMGDDERFDYLYKFISHERMRGGRSERAKAHNMSLLETGDLYVARFDGELSPEYDGTGVWLPLVLDGASQVPGMSLEEVLVFTRFAGDAVGATKMDRPEEVEPSPTTGAVYLACTNNTAREPWQVDAANPRPNNKFGHVIEIDEDRRDAGSTTFTWKILILCGDPDDPSTYFSGVDKSQVSPISCPDNLLLDRRGRLWVSTDGQPGTIGLNDALHAVPTDGDERGKVMQFMSVPTGAETCGPFMSTDETTLLIAVQHPGDVSGASPASPASLFPYDGTGQPRPAVIGIYNQQGDRTIGS